MVRFYKISKDKDYLSLAESIGKALIISVGDDSTYERQFLNEVNPVYTGMNNGIVIEAFNNLSIYSENPIFRDKSISMMKKHKHTTEGVWNHWANSMFGAIISSRILMDIKNEKKLTIQSNKRMNSLISEIEKFDGEIPYFMDKSIDRYPGFSKTYHTYDTMQIAKLTMLNGANNISQDIIEKILSKTSVNHDSLQANNIEAMLYFSKSFPKNDYYKKKAFDFYQPSKVNKSDIISLVSRLRILSSLANLSCTR